MSAKPTSEIELVNLALMQLHQGMVSSLLDENDAAAEAALLLVAPCRRALLRGYMWNFAKKRGAMLKVANKTPKFGFDSFYQQPEDMVRFLAFDPAACVQRYDIEGRYICLDGTANSVNIEYIKDETDVNLWDASFVKAFYLELAIELCMPVTGDLKKQMGLRDRQKEWLPEALGVDLLEKPLEITDESKAQRARESLHDDLGYGDINFSF